MRSRFSDAKRDARPAGARVRFTRSDVARAWAFLQLVRSERSASARSAICVDGGFRQSRRPSRGARAGVHRVCRRRRSTTRASGRRSTQRESSTTAATHEQSAEPRAMDQRAAPCLPVRDGGPPAASDARGDFARERRHDTLGEPAVGCGGRRAVAVATGRRGGSGDHASRRVATSSGAASIVDRLEAARRRAREMANAMDFQLVYDPRRRLLAIGYDARSGKLDESSYDLLASESRLASFIAIAKGDAPTEHWFRLGRSLTVVEGATALVSWSGSMFEYLMPLLVMPPRPFSLLDDTCHSAVHRQIAYGRLAACRGDFRVGVQRARPARHVSIPRVRRARPGAQTRTRERSRGRTLRDGARRRRRRTCRASEL